MQSWKPEIADAPGPKYVAIAEALARDIDAGTLRAGARLPPQRSLAEALGIDLTTVTRAYGEAQRLGLIEGDGRRGSFVRQRANEPIRTAYVEPPDAGMNAPPEVSGGRFVAEYRKAVDALLLGNGPAPFHYQPTGGMALAREAGAGLLAGRGIACREDTVLVASGGQNALHGIVSAELKPGDTLAVAEFVYPGLLALARRYRIRLKTVGSDREGMDPEALAAACGDGGVRGIYVVPTNDNPTTATMGIERRAMLAEVARRHGLTIIEDDAYGLLPEHPLPPIAAIAPERTWHIASVSKVLAPGLRVAWLLAPDVARAWSIAADMHETAIMAPPLNAAIVAEWVGSGVFQQLTAGVRSEAQARQRLARSIMGDDSFHAQHEGYHLWLPLEAGINGTEIVNALRPLGLSAVLGEAFAVDRSTAPPALRVSIGGTISRDRLERGLRLLGALVGSEATQRISRI